MSTDGWLRLLFRAMWWGFAGVVVAGVALGMTIRVAARPVLDELGHGSGGSEAIAGRLGELAGSPAVVVAGIAFAAAAVAFTASFFALVVLAVVRLASSE
jgi:hypothetical protein